MARRSYAAALRAGRDRKEERREVAVSVAVDIHSGDASREAGKAPEPRRRHDQRGAALVEFAIASSVLLVLLFGIISYGYVLSFKQGLTQAAAEGARQAAVGGDYASAVARSVSAFNQTCGTGGLTCTYSTAAADTGCAAGACMRVRVSYDWKNYPLLPQFPGLGLLLPDTLKSTSITKVS
jgi:Flp pilus assembly protein TadG